MKKAHVIWFSILLSMAIINSVVMVEIIGLTGTPLIIEAIIMGYPSAMFANYCLKKLKYKL